MERKDAKQVERELDEILELLEPASSLQGSAAWELTGKQMEETNEKLAAASEEGKAKDSGVDGRGGRPPRRGVEQEKMTERQEKSLREEKSVWEEESVEEEKTEWKEEAEWEELHCGKRDREPFGFSEPRTPIWLPFLCRLL